MSDQHRRAAGETSPIQRETSDASLSLGREVRDAELFAALPRSALGREVRDDELFGASAEPPLPNTALGREVRDSELFDVVPLRPPKRLRLGALKAPTLRSRPAPRASSSTSPSAPDTLHTLSKRPRVSIPAVWELLRAEARSLGFYEPARSLAEMEARFDNLPWRAGRSPGEQRFIGQSPRLSELCLAQLTRNVRAGVVRDLSALPDDFAYAVVTNPLLQVELILVRIEADNPFLLGSLEAAWARMCKTKFEIATLPPADSSWRGLYERCKRDEEERLQQASARLRLRYAEVPPRVTRQVVALPRSTQPTIRRRRSSRATDPAYLPPQSVISRLRDEMRRRRTRRR